MTDSTTHNAIISATRLIHDDHGPELCITVEGDGWGQGFQLLLGPCAEWAPCLFAIMNAVGVRCWEDMIGTAVRVTRRGGLLRTIGHFVRDQWFDPKSWKPGDSLGTYS